MLGFLPVLPAALLAVASAGPAASQGTYSMEERGALECETRDPCEEVLPGAVRFERPEGKPYAIGYDAAGERVGWVVLSNDVVDIKGYSGKPLATLIGLDEEGAITGGKVVHHSEPILLVGIPEQKLQDFVGQHVGVRADETVQMGGDEPGIRKVDAVSGATVTVLAETRTILDSARVLAEDVGVIEPQVAVPGHFVNTDERWSWARMEDEEVFGRLTVRPEQMGLPEADEPFVDLWFTIADAPQVGRALLGDRSWEQAMAGLEEGQHLVVILGNGTSSFKGSGFVRGGIFDRVRLEQGLSTVMFRDLDYTNLGDLRAEGTPRFKEGGLFVTRGGRLDPGQAFALVFLGSRFQTQKGGFEREFHAFKGHHRLPESVYELDGPDPSQAIWRAAWKNSAWKPYVLGAWLLLVSAVFAGRRWSTGRMKRLQKLHTGFLVGSLVLMGFVLGIQPSVTQVLTFVGGLVEGWRWDLFLSEPLVFLSWIFIAAVTLVWGRGVFCGWTCPYGALNELLFRAGRKLRLPELELPEPVHRVARYLRYLVLAGLIGAYLYDPLLGERMAEVEPFKTTFYVKPWTREWYFIGWWGLLLGLSLFTYRPFCRYLCPLGAGLALPSSLRLSGPHRRDFCSKCRICTRGCEPRAIRKDGTIDPRECLSCMECEANWRDDTVCPPLVKKRRDRERAGASRPQEAAGAGVAK